MYHGKMYIIRLQRHFFKLAANERSDSTFLLTLKFCAPGGCLPLPRGYIYVFNHEKNYIKSDFKDIFLNLQQMNEATIHFC